MAESGKVSIDCNDINDNGGEITLTDEKSISLYVVPDTGTSQNYCVGIQLSPEASGAPWVSSVACVRRRGQITIECNAKRARISVFEVEGQASKADCYLIAR